MKWVPSFIILTAASVLMGCASQAPENSTATRTGQANVAATPSGTAAAQANVAATPSGTAANQGNAAATSSGTAAEQAKSGAKTAAVSHEAKPDVQVKAAFLAPPGWRRVVRNGNEFFCQRQNDPDSRAHFEEVCLTQGQLQQMQAASEHYRQTIERMDSGFTPATGAGGAVNVGGANVGGR